MNGPLQKRLWQIIGGGKKYLLAVIRLYKYEGFIYKAAEFLLFSWLGLAVLITWYTQMRFFLPGLRPFISDEKRLNLCPSIAAGSLKKTALISLSRNKK